MTMIEKKSAGEKGEKVEDDRRGREHLNEK